MYMRALKRYEKTLNIKYLLILNIINNLSNFYADQDKLVKIKKIYLRALKEYEKALDIKHISILDTVNRSEDGRFSKSCPFKSLGLFQNNTPTQNIRFFQKLFFKETTVFYLSRFSRGL
jgi:hypothetical protein